MSFGKRLKAAIKYRTTTQKDLAKILDTTPQSISQYVSGKRNPKKDTVAKLATALNLGYNYTNSGEPYFYTFVDNIPSSEHEKAEKFNQEQYQDAIEKALKDEKTFDELANETGLPVETVQSYVKGATAPQIEGLKFLAETFKLSLAETDEILTKYYKELLEMLKDDKDYPSSAYEILEKNIIREPYLDFSELMKKELLSNFDLLSNQGREKLYDYSCDLLKIPEYEATTAPNQDAPDQGETAPDEPPSSNQKEPDKN